MADLDRWVDSWRLLTQERPTLSPEWADAWWHHHRQDEDELLVVLLDDRRGQVVGVAPLYIQKRQGQRVIRFLGSGEMGTDKPTVFSAPGWEFRAADGVAQFLVDSQDCWDLICFDGADVEDPAMCQLVSQLGSAGATVQSQTEQLVECHS